MGCSIAISQKLLVQRKVILIFSLQKLKSNEGRSFKAVLKDSLRSGRERFLGKRQFDEK